MPTDLPVKLYFKLAAAFDALDTLDTDAVYGVLRNGILEWVVSDENGDLSADLTAAQIAALIDTSFTAKTPNDTFLTTEAGSHAFDPLRPNLKVTISGNFAFDITSVPEGKGGELLITRGSGGSETITLNGTLVTNAPTGAAAVVSTAYVNQGGTVRWYCQNPAEVTQTQYQSILTRLANLESGLPTLGTPTVTFGSPTTTSIPVNWSTVTNATGYTVKRNTTNTQSGATTIYTGSLLTFTDTGLTIGTAYYYFVTPTAPSYNNGAAGAATTSTVALTPLTAPTLSTPSVISSTQLNLAWTNVANESNYQLERSTDNATWSTINSPAADVTTYNNTGLTASTLYYYRIKAIGNGTVYSDSSYSSTASATTSAANVAPVASSVAFTGTATEGQTLTGTYTYSDANSDAEGTSLKKWYRSDNTSALNRAAISGATGSTYVLQAGDVGKYIQFAVTPVASAGVTTGTEVFSAYSAVIAAAAVNPNLLTKSYGFYSGTPFNTSNMTMEAGTAPDGGTLSISKSSANNSYWGYDPDFVVLTTGQQYTIYVDVKAGSLSAFRFSMVENRVAAADFNLATATVSGITSGDLGTGASASIEDLSSTGAGYAGYYRCKVTFTYTHTGIFYFSLNPAGWTTSGDTMNWWRLQINTGSTALPYSARP